MVALRSALSQDLKDIVVKHLEELGMYISPPCHNMEKTPETILDCLERLNDIICEFPPHEVSYEQYQEVSNCRDTVQQFLTCMNQPTSPTFQTTSVGQLWIRAADWHKIASKQFRLTIQEVWNMIAPAVPDRLVDIGNGQYEARWWKPVPMMDIEILNRTEGVIMYDEPFEPHNLQGGLACRFALCVSQSNENSLDR